MKKIIYILLLTMTVFGCGQKKKYPFKTSDFRHELKDKIDRIGTVNPDTLITNYLRDSCSKEELLDLMICENPYVRVVAFKAIVNRNEPDYFSILLNHLDDTAIVGWWPADDVESEDMVSDLMILKVQYNKKLNRIQKDVLIDTVLFKHLYLNTAFYMVRDIQPKEKYYSIIKKLAQKKIVDCHDLSRTYSLAKFKKQGDIQIIKKNFSDFTNNPYCNDYFFQAIEAFPDTAFFPLLEKYFNEIIKKEKQDRGDDLKFYCRAVAQYKSNSSLKILTALTKKETYPDNYLFSYNQESVFKAIHKYPSPLYDGLYNKLKPQIKQYIMNNIDEPDYDEEISW